MTLAVTTISQGTLYANKISGGSHPVTTVDADSLSAQKVLNVAATTDFVVGDTVVIDDTSAGGGREEGVVASISAGVSLTMEENLQFTHTAVQADEVTPKFHYISFYKDFSNGTNTKLMSPWSDEISVTYDATNKQAALFVDPSMTNAINVLVGRSTTTEDYEKNDTANFARVGGSVYTQVLNVLGDTTVDQDSASGATTLFVASTTNFAANNYIIIDPGGPKQEFARISSVTAGVSFTLTANLSNTHLAADAAEVWESLGTDNFSDSRRGTDWKTLTRHITNKVGLARVVATGTGVTFDDYYQDAALHEIYIFRHDDNAGSQIVGGGIYDAHICAEIGDDSTTTEVVWKNCVIRLWGRLGYGVGALGTGANATFELGEKNTNTRENGTVLMLTAWRTVNNSFPASGTFNAYDSRIIQTDAIIKADALETGVGVNTVGWGNDFNWIFAATAAFEATTMVGGEKVRWANASGNAVTFSDFRVSSLDQFEVFYSADTARKLFESMTIEGGTTPLWTGGNPQGATVGTGIIWKDVKAVDAVTAEAYLQVVVDTFFVDLQVVGGSASNTNFKMKLNTSVWNTGSSNLKDIDLLFTVELKVIDSAGAPVDGARVRIYNSNALTTLASELDTASSTTSYSDWDNTTDANGDIDPKPVLWERFEAGQGTPSGDQTDTLDNLVTNTWLARTTYHPYLLLVSKSGYYDHLETLELDEGKNLVIQLRTTQGIP